MAAAVLMPMVSFRDESTLGDWQVLGRDEPKKKILVKQTSLMQSEREISMDPISIKSLSLSPSLKRNDSFDMVLLPAMSPPRDLDSPMPLPLQPVRTKSASRSLPSSTATSPKQRSGLMRALKGREQDSSSSSGLLRALRSKEQDSSSGLMRALKRKEQDSSSGLMRALKSKEQDSSSSSGLMRALRRKEQDSSSSSGLMRALKGKEQDSSSSSGLMRALKGKEQDSSSSSGLMRALKGKEQDSSSSSGLMRAFKGKEQDSSSSSASFRRSISCKATKSSGTQNSFLIKTESNKNINNNHSLEDGFKCNALCLYLPGFGKEKPVRSSRKDDSSSLTRTTTMTTSSSSSLTVSRTVSVRETTTTTTVISARASMEIFDCGSYTSDSTGDEGGGHFDLPSELIKSGSGENDQDDPVSAAFVFDKKPAEKEIKGVLKVSGSSNRRSMESSLRHVRFSTSSPVSYPTSPAISPRLLEATKNFNAFLEAQSV